MHPEFLHKLFKNLSALFLFYLVDMPQSNEKPTCEICGKEFATKSTLKNHLKNKVPCKAPANLIQTVLEEAGVPTPSEPSGPFRPVSKKFHTTLSKEVRLEEGIFFTPKKVRDLLFAKLAELNVKPKTILEPSFGSGEFLLDAQRHYPTAKLIGVEKNKKLFDSLKMPSAKLENMDFTEWEGSADVIIGNPPYFVMKAGVSAKEKKAFHEKYEECMTGRPNMYVIFIYQCLKEHLLDNGFLAFVIPTSLFNCSYYQPLRNYIEDNSTICHLEILDIQGFFETGLPTALLFLQKKQPPSPPPYIFHSALVVSYITPHWAELKKITENTTTLYKLGLGVKTGSVVWNQVKDHLTDDSSETLLIYASNINKSELKLNNLLGTQKKQYVKKMTKPTLAGPVILVERGYGNGFSFNAVLCSLTKFYAENHINVIYAQTKESEKNLERVLASFKDKRSMQFIKMFMGNGSMSSTELETLMPVF